MNGSAGGLYGAVEYQWRKDWIAIPGARSRLLYLPDFHVDDAGSYDVMLTNAGGSVVSNAVGATLNPSPTPRS